MIQQVSKLYEAYEQHGIEWLASSKPKHWAIRRIKDLAFLQSGDSIVSEQIEENGQYPVYGGNGLRGFYSKYTNDGEHILIGRQGALCGNINYASGKFWASEHAVVVYLNRSVCMKWFGETLRVMNLNQYSLSAAQPGLAMDRIKRLLLPVPSFPEQKAIASYIDQKTTKIDKQIDLLTQKAKHYGELKQALINETVTRGLDKSVPMKDSGVEWIGEIPAHWELKRLKDIGVSIIGITYSPDDVLDNGANGSLVLRSSNIQNGKLSLLDNVYINKAVNKKQILKKGDILICSRNGSRALIGKNICIDERTAGQTFGAFMTVYRSRYFRFISKYFNSNVFESQSGLFGSSTVNQLTINTLNNFVIFLPSTSEQKAIADYLNEKTAQIDAIVEAINAQIEKLKELRKTLINDVVTGKICIL